jgi:hypothetical protein
MPGFFMPGAGAKKFDKFLNRHLTAHGPMGGPLKNIIGAVVRGVPTGCLPAKDKFEIAAPRRGRHYLRTSCQKSRNGGNAHQQGCGEQDLIARK